MKNKLLFLAIIFGFLISCAKDEPTPTPGQNEVFINNMKFSPSSITVSSGTTITWTNQESITHTVTSDNSVFDSGNLGNGNSFSYTFSTVGTFPYHCKYHSSMTATVIVQ